MLALFCCLDSIATTISCRQDDLNVIPFCTILHYKIKTGYCSHMLSAKV